MSEGLFACGACACCCFLVLLGLGLAGLGIAKIVVGAIYLHDCPIEPLIPVFLIVSGVAPLFLSGLGKRDDDDSGITISAKTVCGLIGLLFSIAWSICGSVWIYPNYTKRFADDFVPCNQTMKVNCTEDCNADLMKFSFAMVTMDWICMGLWIVLLLCMCCGLLKSR